MKKFLKLAPFILVLFMSLSFLGGCGDDNPVSINAGPTGPTGSVGIDGAPGIEGPTGPAGPGELASLRINIFEADGTTPARNFNITLTRMGSVQRKIEVITEQQENGTYLFDNLATGQYLAVISGPLYVSEEMEINVEAGQDNEVNVNIIKYLFGIDWDGIFYLINPLTSELTPAGNTGFLDTYAMDADPETKTVYATGFDEIWYKPYLYTFNIDTGKATEIGLTSIDYDNPDMSFNSEGILYGYFIRYSDISGHLGKINLTTGNIFPFIGPTGLDTWYNGLAFSSDDTLYLISDSTIYTLDPDTGLPGTGTVSLESEVYISSMDFNPFTGELFGIQEDDDGNPPVLVIVNPDTGDIEEIGPFTDDTYITAICWPW